LKDENVIRAELNAARFSSFGAAVTLVGKDKWEPRLISARQIIHQLGRISGLFFSQFIDNLSNRSV
jgi:hypothetical protein